MRRAALVLGSALAGLALGASIHALPPQPVACVQVMSGGWGIRTANPITGEPGPSRAALTVALTDQEARLCGVTR